MDFWGVTLLYSTTAFLTLDIATQFQYVAALYFAPAQVAKYLD